MIAKIENPVELLTSQTKLTLDAVKLVKKVRDDFTCRFKTIKPKLTNDY